MAAWYILLLALLVMVHPAIQGSVNEQNCSFQNEDALKIVSAMEDVGQVLQDFDETMKNKESRDDVLYCMPDLLRQSLVVQNYCSSSLDKMAGSVELLIQKNTRLENEVKEKDEKVQRLTEEITRLEKEKEAGGKISAVLLAAGYEHFPGLGYYKYSSQSLTWDEAVQACKAAGSHLGIINSVREAEVFASIIARHPEVQGQTYNDYYFVGVSDVNGDRHFYTIDGIPLSETGYSTWRSGEPNNSGVENCVAMYKDAKFNDVHCLSKLPYICEFQIPLNQTHEYVSPIN